MVEDHQEKPEQISRRKALKLIAAGASVAAGAGLASLAGASIIGKEGKKRGEAVAIEPATPTSIPETESQEPVAGPDLRTMLFSEQKNEEMIEIVGQLMSLHPRDKQREERELTVVEIAKTKGWSMADLVSAMSGFASINARIEVVQLIQEKRQSGELEKFRIYPLSEEKLNWAEANNIDPNILAIAEECFLPTLALLSARKDLFLEAVKNNQIPLIYRIPNPGVMAKLMMTETGIINANNQGQDYGFVNIGSKGALSQINYQEGLFPTAKEDLAWIAQQVESITNLPFTSNLKTIPGSFKSQGSLSGGAIGPQLMPINAKRFMEWYNAANKEHHYKYPSPNPFEPWTGTILAYLYLAGEYYALQGRKNPETGEAEYIKSPTVIRSGYIAGDPQRMRDALWKWNMNKNQGAEAIKSGVSYWEKFLKDNDFREEYKDVV